GDDGAVLRVSAVGTAATAVWNASVGEAQRSVSDGVGKGHGRAARPVVTADEVLAVIAVLGAARRRTRVRCCGARACREARAVEEVPRVVRRGSRELLGDGVVRECG